MNGSDYFYEQRDAVVESSYFQRLAQLVEDLTQFYRDMQSMEWPSNVPKYLTKIRTFLQQKYADIDEYVLLIEKIRLQLEDWYVTLLRSNPEYQKFADAWNKFVSLADWSLEHLQVGRQMKLLIAHVRERMLEEFRQTSTEARMRYQLDKTRLRYNPELGLIELEQKLPFPWIGFDQRPRFEELPELQRIQSLLAFFKSSNSSLIDQIMSYVPEQDLADWLPPFKSSAQFIGLQHYVTFNGVHYEFTGPCTYLLARDFKTHNFTLAVHYVSTRGKPYASVLQLVVDEAQWDLDLANKTIRVAGNNCMLPTEERGTVAYHNNGRFVIHSAARGLRLECVAAYEVCTLTLSGK